MLIAGSSSSSFASSAGSSSAVSRRCPPPPPMFAAFSHSLNSSHSGRFVSCVVSMILGWWSCPVFGQMCGPGPGLHRCSDARVEVAGAKLSLMPLKLFVIHCFIVVLCTALVFSCSFCRRSSAIVACWLSPDPAPAAQ